MRDSGAFTERYIAVWSEPVEEQRRGHRALQKVVTAVYNWARTRAGTGEVIGTGFDLLMLDDDRIAADYEFADPPEAGGELNAIRINTCCRRSYRNSARSAANGSRCQSPAF